MASQRLKLTILTGSYPNVPCGISPYVAQILRRLIRREQLDITVVTGTDSTIDRNAVAGCRVVADIKSWAVRHFQEIAAAVLQQQPDIVFIQNPTVNYPGFKARVMNRVAAALKHREPDIRLCVFQHDIAVSHPLTRWRYDGLFRAVDAIVVSNQRDWQAIRDRGIADDKIIKAPFSSYFQIQGCDPGQKQAARRRMSIPPEAVCLVYFGYVVPGRCIDQLLQATRLLIDRGYPVHTLILGGPHPGSPDYFDQCRALGNRLGLDGHLIWTGFADDQQVIDGLNAADIFVSLPERGADMRNTSILTGILAGLPVITSRNDRYYRDPDLEAFGCITVSPRQPRQITQAVAALIETPVRPKELTQRATRLEPDRVWEAHIDMLLRAFGLS